MIRRLATAAAAATLLLAGCSTPTKKDSEGGLKTDSGVTKDEIRIGLLSGFTGPVAEGAISSAAGFDARLAKANEDGGVCGRDLVSVRGDTKYDASVAVQTYRANSGDVVMIGQLLGASTIFGLSKQIERDNIATYAATSAASVLPLKNIYLFTSPFPVYVINGLTWAKENLADGDLEVGIVYQNDDFGKEGLESARFVAENDPGVEIGVEVSYDVEDEDMTAQVTKLKESGVDVVWIHGIPGKTSMLVSQAAQLGYSPTWIAVDGAYDTSLADQLGDLLEDFYVVTSSASFGEDVPGLSELEDYLNKVNPDVDPTQLVITGWINASVAVAAIEAACEAEDLTQEGVIAAMSNLTVDTNGLAPELAYGEGSDPNTRIPSRATKMNTIDLESGYPEPITDFYESDLAKEWELPAGD